MTTVSTFSLSRFIPPLRPSRHASSALSPLQIEFPCIRLRNQFKNSPFSCYLSMAKFNKHGRLRPTNVMAATEDEINFSLEEATLPPASISVSDQTASVAVSPSDALKMFFQAEGTMTDSAIPAVTKALEGLEGLSDVKVQVLEGIASVELTKQTTVQATGVASNLIETIQGFGFKLQTLNLSFQDEEDLT